MNQIKIHQNIISLLSKDPDTLRVDDVLPLVLKNDDAKQYFFSKADEKWLDWLWQNKFLEVIKQKADDTTRYGYRTPEINYLVKVAEKVPAKVVDIILEIEISKDNFNPEVIDRFLWIASILPAEQLARVIPNILKQKWSVLMGGFKEWGFEYDKMFKILSDAKDFDNLLLLSQVVLSVKTKEEFYEKHKLDSFWKDTPFYINQLHHTKIFKHLVSLPNSYQEKALELTTEVMSKIVSFGGDIDKDNIFDVQDSFYFFDVDFFTLKLGQSKSYSSTGDVQELAATIKVLSEKLIGAKCLEVEAVKNIYDKYIKILPDSRSMWRLRLFVMTLCVEVFKEELKSSFSRLFGKYPYHEIISGAEYSKALRIVFPKLEEEYKREYVRKVFDYFNQDVGDEKERKWNQRHGWEILSSICQYLTDDEKEKCEAMFGAKCDASYEPEPSIGQIKGGLVTPRGPITPEEFHKIPVEEIVKFLKDAWTPENLYKKYRADEITNPRNAEGAGKLLKEDVSKRLQEYINNAVLFFDPDSLDQHYIYSFFRGIEDAIKNDREPAVSIDWTKLIDLFIAIKEYNKDSRLDKSRDNVEKFDVWLANWDSVHSAMTDVVQLLIGEGEKNYVIDFNKYKKYLFDTIAYLLKYRDPIPADEEPKTATSTITSPGEKPLVIDPYSMAINRVRGRAFQAFILFVYRDGNGINSEVKKLYKDVLEQENTRAVMFMFGRFIPSFYFRDKDWVKELLPKLFPIEADKSKLYLAAWEGYLSNAIYEEIFFDEDFQKLYYRGLDIVNIKETHRRYFKDPEESIAIHLALAFMNYKNFGFRHPLFQAFWQAETARHEEFIHFLGSMFISGKNDRADKLIRENKLSKQRLEKIWDFALERDEEKEFYSQFGFWMNLEKDIFDIKWLAERIRKTLQKGGGIVDWDYGLSQAIIKLAEEVPEEAIEIAKAYLLGSVRENKPRIHLYIERQWFKALEILFVCADTKNETYKLINDLIVEGGSSFWGLEDIVKDKK